MSWIVNRVKEWSSWNGGVLVAVGLLLLLGFPMIKIAAYGAIGWGILSIIKKD